LWADWKDEIGFTRLQSIAGAELPTDSTLGFTQVEALESGSNYTPNAALPLFSNITIIPKSGPSATSNHATNVAANFYASTSQQPGVADVDLYNVDNWIGSGFLQSGSLPATELRGVQNHSWIGTSPSASVLSARLDYAINRDGFVCVVGENNGNSTTLPDLLGQGYHTISVGLVNGSHSAGVTTVDVAGRIKPDIVAPSSATSYATPMVSGAAGLLHEKLSSSYAISGANIPRVVKALLLASATKNTVAGTWANTANQPLDSRYGAGELNIHHAYLALRAGKATAGNIQYGIRGWAAESVGRNSSKVYFFSIPVGAPSTPFCAALTWHRSISTTFWTGSLANLKLGLYHATGTNLGSLIAESDSSVDNVELLYQPALPPGDYAIAVSKGNNSGSTPYALAWHSLPAVSAAATVSNAREIDGQAGVIIFTRTGDTTLPLYVPLTIGGTAIAGTHYQALPASVTIPAGQTSSTLQIVPISDNLAQGERSITLSVAADFALVRDPSQSGVVTIEDKPFDQWRFDKFTTTELANPSISSETADPDADQLANLIEYALTLEPKTPDISPVAMIDSGGYLALSTTKNPDATDIIWAAETTNNLDAWNPAVTLTNTTNTFTARDTVLIDAAETRFIRLKIIRP
jgi:hypothetical protein